MKPEKIGRYHIKSELGRGGMATVFLAHDPRFNRNVAIKLLPHELLHQPTFRARFEREAKIVAALDIPAIVPVYDYGEEEGQPYLVMRYMAGGTLADRLQIGPLSLAETARIIDYLAPALDEAHARGIIHRDLKPSNILFDQRDNPHISDFGTALITQAHMKLTDTGGAVGTPAYMSPEQIRGVRTLDGRSDLYAIGIITFEMLTGKHPYQTNTPIGIALQHIIDPVPRLLDTQPDLPPHCQAVITRALAKNRKNRYPTVKAYAVALNQVTMTQVTAVSPINWLHQNRDMFERSRWRNTLYSQAFMVIALLLLTLLVIINIKNRVVFSESLTQAAGTATYDMEPTAVSPTPPPPTVTQPTRTPSITPAATPTVTAVAAKTATPAMIKTPTATENAPLTITASQSASIFARTDANSQELAIIRSGETVTVLGRSQNGHWLYVLKEPGIVGYVFAERLGWNGETEYLPVRLITPSLGTEADACQGGCPLLKIDAYPLPGGRCENDIIYRTIYLRGQGGSGTYTYYWDDQKMAGPLRDQGFGFEVNNLNGLVIGRAKVVSSDGQTAERELFIAEFSCD